MLNKYLIVSFILLSISLTAQEKSNDIQLISATIENYFNGYINRDITKLNKAFDVENGAMKVSSISEDGTEYFENSYFKDLIPRWSSKEKLSPIALKNCKLKILNIDIVEGKIGTAKIRMKIGDAVYVDILSLQKMNQQWKITNKIYTVIAN